MNRIDALSKNYIINGGFDYWQRGSGGTLTDTFYADRTRVIFGGGASPQVLKVTDVPPNVKTKFAMRFTNTQNDQANFVAVSHRIESIFSRELKDEPLSLGFWIKTDHATTVKLQIQTADVEDDFSAQTEILSITKPLVTDGVYQFISFENFTLAAADVVNGIQVVLEMEDFVDLVSATSFTIAQIKLSKGEKVQEFSRAGRDVFEELQYCQRYYGKSYNIETDPGTATEVGMVTSRVDATSNVSNHSMAVRFKVTMRIAPAITTFTHLGGIGASVNTSGSGGTHGFTNVSSVSLILQIGQDGFGGITIGISRPSCGIQYTADAEL